MKNEYSLLRFTIELQYVNELKNISWWQFRKRKELDKWRDSKLKEHLK